MLKFSTDFHEKNLADRGRHPACIYRIAAESAETVAPAREPVLPVEPALQGEFVFGVSAPKLPAPAFD